MFYAIYIAFTLSMNNLYVLTFAVKNNPDHVSLQMLNISTSVKKTTTSEHYPCKC